VLDYPKISGAEFPILFRTLFWWGNYFSFNVIVQDKKLQHDIRLNEASEVYVLTGSDRWENDLYSSAYIKVKGSVTPDMLPQTDFLRIASTLPIDAYETLIEKSQFYLRFIHSYETK
ncbi:MAG: hypothetical protein ACK566_02355, partial [Bacteroidota bacterium]